jgi:hypothetical protein
MADLSKLSELIERSSLGTAGARSLRERIHPDVAQIILDRSVEQDLRKLAAAGDTSAAGRLIVLLADRGDIESLRELADAGS